MLPLLSKEGVGAVGRAPNHPYPSSIEERSHSHSRLYAQKVRRTTARRRQREGDYFIDRRARPYRPGNNACTMSF